jgi:hypothetical protein
MMSEDINDIKNLEEFRPKILSIEGVSSLKIEEAW